MAPKDRTNTSQSSAKISSGFQSMRRVSNKSAPNQQAIAAAANWIRLPVRRSWPVHQRFW